MTIGSVGPRYHHNTVECFECLKCEFEFRLDIQAAGSLPEALAFPCRRPDCKLCGKGPKHMKRCRQGGCPVCGHLYIEWLSYDLPAESIYFSREWGSGKRAWVGSMSYRPSDEGKKM